MKFSGIYSLENKYLSKDMYNTIKERLINASYGEYVKYANEIIKNGIKNVNPINDSDNAITKQLI